MESGARSGEHKNEAARKDQKDQVVAPEATKVIEDAHNGFFQDLNVIHNGILERLTETHKKYARPSAELQTQTPANIQSLHEEYFKAMQAAHSGSDMAAQVAAAFEKYKIAAIQALGATTDPAGLALLSQSMYIVAMYAGQLQLPRSTP
jgi:hypothetical protein